MSEVTVQKILIDMRQSGTSKATVHFERTSSSGCLIHEQVFVSFRSLDDTIREIIQAGRDAR